MENVLGYIVGIWFVTSVFLTGVVLAMWLGWNVSRMVKSK